MQEITKGPSDLSNGRLIAFRRRLLWAGVIVVALIIVAAIATAAIITVAVGTVIVVTIIVVVVIVVTVIVIIVVIAVIVVFVIVFVTAGAIIVVREDVFFTPRIDDRTLEVRWQGVLFHFFAGLHIGVKDKPPLDEVRCVRPDFTDACEAEAPAVWSSDDDRGGFRAATLRPAARRVDARGVHAGTFLARSSATQVEASALACLKNNGANHTSAMPDLAQVHAVLAAYSPLVYLHPDEPYMPSSVAWFFENGALLHQRTGNQTPTLVAADGSNLPQGGDNDGNYWLDLPAGSRDQRERVKKGDLAGAKAYVQVKPMLGGTVTDLAMWFYPFNGPARARLLRIFTIPLGSIGSHVGDWEHLTLRVSNFSGELLRVYFSQHSAGTWVDAPQLEYADGGNSRPVAYASLHGHAFWAGLELQGSADAGIRNDSAKGSMFDTGGAGRCEVASAGYLGVAEPAWLGFMRP
ncbi:hypothetical protein BAE44_0016222 [Dichanthelium oligosanthes]|uniref:Vacuolar protein sorting-associated protein 62 n=1 Tax=Dichanthelium oligosanthes TaxID=888268 RepID=A0A1E5VCD1_9POAL|nr:hypothetical protein BAE44_0016222 [Dichanthelium oligosanthes]